MSRNSSRDSRTRSNEEVRRRTVNPGVRGRSTSSESDVGFEVWKFGVTGRGTNRLGGRWKGEIER